MRCHSKYSNARNCFTAICLIALAVCNPNAIIAEAAEPPVTAGLIVRLDASQPGPADKTDGGEAIERWENLAGDVHHFEQSLPDARPTRIEIDSDFVLRFDGINDHLRSVSNSHHVKSLTAFVVVAPHENAGDFRGFLAANAKDSRDYESGFNIDMGPVGGRTFDSLNAEGPGFGGALDLLNESFPFGTLHIVSLRISADERQSTMWIDGNQQGSRVYEPAEISLKEITIGARYFTNGPGDQQVRCAAKCDIAEALIYDRALSNDEIESIHGYLEQQHRELSQRLPQVLSLSHEQFVLQKVEQPPLVQMLVPGFEITELPIELPNINNIRYRQDGTLVALGYNGDIHLLRDTNGDGLEDRSHVFWESQGSLRGPIGMLLTPDGYPRGSGVFTPSKGKVSLIVDQDGDDRADEEIVVATGWKEIAQNVDATGIAMDEEGWLYFGLGTADYANAYQVNESGVAAYDLSSDRGTVQRLSPDFMHRETVCTGIRFPIALAFNAQGDLFCTEQEGATWLANGNPFDELLHIEPNKHYGFPPRHPRHNPSVIDEPAVFNYAPQHQSTCGMVFNMGVQGGSAFGPAMWHGSAIVSGESRGKLWATQLAKTKQGYVAKSQLIACLQMLTVDACISPRGDLIVACHSGPPDWGTGPTGIGKLFRIRMTEPSRPRPTSVWANSEREIQVAFDQPLDPLALRGELQRLDIQYGEFVRAGDRYETLVPPYAVVQRQLLQPRHRLAVFGVGLSPDRRNLFIQTAPMTGKSSFALTIPSATEGVGAVSSLLNATELDFQLHGLRATFQSLTATTENNDLLPSGSVTESVSAAVSEEWQGWLPHLNWQVASAFTANSSSHTKLGEIMASGGKLAVESRLDLSDVLRPKVQPGATLDYDWPAEQVSLELTSAHPFFGTVGGESLAVTHAGAGQYSATVHVPSSQAAACDISLTLELPKGAEPDWNIAMFTAEDATRRPLPLDRFLLPWVIDNVEGTVTEPASNVGIPELAGGSWGRGRRVFHSEAAGCFKCHALNGPGPKIGPDLSNLVHRDYASVLRDIRNPSYAINPDHVGHILVTKDDQVLTGVLRTENGRLLLGDATGNSHVILPDSIESSKPSEVSVMPQGVDEKLTPEQMKDLMTFLLTPPPHMPLESPLTAPPLRTQAEVAAVLAGSESITGELKPLNIVLVAGEKDHGPGEHDYPAWQVQWGQLLASAPAVQVSAAWDFPSQDQLSAANVLIFFQKGTWNDDRQRQLDAYLSRGGGAVYIHWAVNGDERVGDFSERIGLASRGGSIGYRHGPLDLAIHNTDHPIMRNIDTLQLYDESYWKLTGDPQRVTLFATSVEEGAATPQLWAYERGQGKVFVSIPGHYSWTFDDPIFRTILLRGISWTANEPVDRFNELVPLGARMSR